MNRSRLIQKETVVKSYESLNHTKWECKYHVVFIPKYRRKALYGELRKHLGEVLHDLAKQRESKIEQGNLVITMCIC